MKAVLALMFLGVLTLVACNNSGGGSSSGTATQNTYASTPQPCNYPGSVNCQYYQNYYAQNPMAGPWPYGNWFWPQQYLPNLGNCGCPAGYFPVAGPFGAACAPAAYQVPRMVYFNYGWGGVPYWNYSQNGGYINTPQQTYNPSTNSCGNSTAQGCDVRMNNCPSGTRCQPVGGGSTAGLCVR